jgi:hypothetical protein
MKEGATAARAAGGVIALMASAEFGLPAIAVGAGMSLFSGALALKDDEKPAEVCTTTKK